MNTELMMQNLTKGDPDAFQQFYDRYSLPVYHYIMDKTGDPERSRQLWRNTFRGLLSMLRSGEAPDMPFLLLTALADRQLDMPAAVSHGTPSAGNDVPSDAQTPASPVCTDAVSSDTTEDAPSAPAENMAAPAPVERRSSAPDAPPSAPEATAGTPPSDAVSAVSAASGSMRRAGLVGLLILLILLGIFALWTATGFLMALDVLPAYDLGYTWFNQTFFRLFPSSFP